MKRSARTSVPSWPPSLPVACDDNSTSSSAPPTVSAWSSPVRAPRAGRQNIVRRRSRSRPSPGARPADGAQRPEGVDDVAAGRIADLKRVGPSAPPSSPPNTHRSGPSRTSLKHRVPKPSSGMRWKSGAGQLHFCAHRTEIGLSVRLPTSRRTSMRNHRRQSGSQRGSLRRAQGKPVNSADTETTYPPTCLRRRSTATGKPRWPPRRPVGIKGAGKVGGYDANSFRAAREGSEPSTWHRRQPQAILPRRLPTRRLVHP